MDKWISKGLYQHPTKYRPGTFCRVCLSGVGIYYLRVGAKMITCPQSWAARIHQAENIEILREACEAGGTEFTVVKMENRP